MEDEKPKTRNKIIMYFALLMLLVVLPGMSWFYLSKGANFYRGIMSELGEYGQVDKKLGINNKVGEKKVYIIGLDYDSFDKLDMMNYVYQEFKDSDKVGFLTTSNTVIDTIPQIFNQYKSSKKIGGTWKNSITSSDGIKASISFPDKKDFEIKPLSEYLILMDTFGQVRNYYYLGDTMSMNRLITTTSVIMPRGQKEDMIYEPETEL